MRRIAVHKLFICNEVIEMAVIELVGGYVKSYYPLEGEMAMTEWIGGEAYLKTDNQGRQQLLINNKILC